MLIPKLPKVKIIDEIDTGKYPWCDSAVIFSVKNGRGSLTHTVSPYRVEDDSYIDYYCSQLLLEKMPVMQGKYPICPTCTGLLAVGYGIENINCPELKTVRENINCEYKNIRTSAEILSPLLGLLDDGIYALADVPHFPSNGDGNFFYCAPNVPVEFSAACDSFYLRDFLTCVDGFPAYLYPTQSDELINIDRVKEYVEIMENNLNAPRGIAYYEKGFISALLDGHHKACAAACLGQTVSCLTIIRADSFRAADGHKTYDGAKTPVKSVFFSGIEYPAKKGEVWGDYCSLSDRRELEPPLPKYFLTGRDIDDEMMIREKNYPTTETLAGICAVGIDGEEITDELISEWIRKPDDDENTAKLRYTLAGFMMSDRERAYRLAKEIIRHDSGRLPQREAWKALLQFKKEETEQLMIDYIVSHTKSDRYWDIATSYWD